MSKVEKGESKAARKREVKKHPRTKNAQLKKTEPLQKRLNQAEEEIRALKDRLLRSAAELDNYRKRTERQFAQIVESTRGEVIKDILPVIDDLERSLKSGQKGKAFFKGVELIYQKLTAILRNRGLAPMESVGMAFDVERHDALLQVEKEGVPSGIVLEEHEKGYLLNGNVLRHTRVVVSK